MKTFKFRENSLVRGFVIYCKLKHIKYSIKSFFFKVGGVAKYQKNNIKSLSVYSSQVKILQSTKRAQKFNFTVPYLVNVYL